MPEPPEHVIAIEPTLGSDGETWYRPVCSCGHPGNGIWDTRDGAERSGQRHVDSFRPHEPGRYVSKIDDGWFSLWCNDCQVTFAGWQGSGDYAASEKKFADSFKAHEEERHGEDQR
jgi:hypothetical protein